MITVEKTGKTVDEAVSLAVAELGVARDAVQVDVIEESSQGFFGLFGNRLAKVRVSVPEQAPAAAVELPADVTVQDPVAAARLGHRLRGRGARPR